MSQLAAELLASCISKLDQLQHESILSSLGSSWLILAQALLFGHLL